MHPCILIGGLAASLLLFPSGCANAAPMHFSPFLPTISVDPELTTAFAAGVDGRLIAINLADGKIGWRSQRPLEALGFANGAVVASTTVENCGHCLQLVWLSAADGREQRTSSAITFPDWVSVAPAVGKQFWATVEMDGASIVMHWKASNRYVGGAHPTSRILEDFKKDADGTFMVDAQGQAEAVATQSKAATLVPAALREVKTTTLWNCSEWSDVPIVDRDGMVAFDRAVGVARQTLSARRWRLPTGQLDATRQLMQGSNLELQISPDARYLFVHDGALQTDTKASTNWHVYSLGTLRPVVSIPYPPGQTCANVAADVVVTLMEKSPPSIRGGSQSRELVAYATSNGALRWSVKLRGYPQQALPR